MHIKSHICIIWKRVLSGSFGLLLVPLLLPAAQSLTLPRCIALARARAPQLVVSKRQVAVARALLQRSQGIMQRLVFLESGVGYLFTQQERMPAEVMENALSEKAREQLPNVGLDPLFQDYTLFGSEHNLRWSVLRLTVVLNRVLWAAGAREKQAAAYLKLTRCDHGLQQRAVDLLVSKVYYTLLMLQKTTAYLEELRTLLAVFVTPMAGKSGLARARIAAFSARLETFISEAEGGRRQAEKALSHLVYGAAAKQRIMAAGAEFTQVNLAAVSDKVLNRLAGRCLQPDHNLLLRKLDHYVVIRKLGVDAAVRGPDLLFQAGLDYDVRFRSGYADKYSAWALLGIRIPLYLLFSGNKEEQEARARYRKVLALRSDARDKLRLQVDNLVHKVRTARRTAARLRNMLAAVEKRKQVVRRALLRTMAGADGKKNSAAAPTELRALLREFQETLQQKAEAKARYYQVLRSMLTDVAVLQSLGGTGDKQ